MFRDVPECSGMFHVPGFIDTRNYLRRAGFISTHLYKVAQEGLQTHSSYVTIKLPSWQKKKNSKTHLVVANNREPYINITMFVYNRDMDVLEWYRKGTEMNRWIQSRDWAFELKLERNCNLSVDVKLEKRFHSSLSDTALWTSTIIFISNFKKRQPVGLVSVHVPLLSCVKVKRTMLLHCELGSIRINYVSTVRLLSTYLEYI